MEPASRVEFAEAQAAAWMEDRGVTDSILITAARHVFHHEPGWRDELPTSVQRAAGDRRIANPAAVGLDEPDGATSNTVLLLGVDTRELPGADGPVRPPHAVQCDGGADVRLRRSQRGRGR
jgi:hypothetical protein